MSAAHSRNTGPGSSILPARTWDMGTPGASDMTTMWRFCAIGVGTGKPRSCSAFMNAYLREARGE
jgi:hypothetical protein